jgi:hypothetical protein
MGWEAAVLDHFRAVAGAIAAKVRGGPRSEERDVVGGATLSFRLTPEHPYWDRVHGLLARTRSDANALWDEVEAYNVANPAPGDARLLWFYFGQYFTADRAEGEA